MFKVKQKVWCAIYGVGVVEEIQYPSKGTYPVIVRFTDEICDYYTVEGKYQVAGNITLFPYPVEIVKAIVKPSIIWSHVKDEYKWLAVDANGGAYVFEYKPVFDDSDYWYSIDGPCFDVSGLSSYSRGTCDWKDSLIKRP